MGILVDLIVLQEDPELSVETRLNILAVFGQSTGLVDKGLDFFVGISVLLEALDWRDPGRFADEVGDFTALFANRGKDLDTRGSAGVN